jgi:hypothetical protein
MQICYAVMSELRMVAVMAVMCGDEVGMRGWRCCAEEHGWCWLMCSGFMIGTLVHLVWFVV